MKINSKKTSTKISVTKRRGVEQKQQLVKVELISTTPCTDRWLIYSITIHHHLLRYYWIFILRIYICKGYVVIKAVR